jgi:LuxR family maltose regulon positive regulatory protein
LAQYAIGNLSAADLSFSRFMEDMVNAGNVQDALGVVFLMGDIRRTLGRLEDGIRLYQQSLRLAADQGEPMPVGSSDLYRGLSELYLERGDLQGAEQQLLMGKKLGEQAAPTDWEHRLCVSQATLLQARGDLEGALTLLDRAESLHVRNPLPNVRPVAAQKARVLLKQGRLADAQDWIRASDLSAGDDLSYLREFEHATLCRVLIAQFRSGGVEADIQDAVELLERLLSAVEEGGRMGSAIEILALLALAREARGESSAALDYLARALTLAEPEGYFRTFVDEGRPMASLLAEAARHGIAPVYAGRLLAALGPAEDVQEQRSPLSGEQLLIEPLSQRELEVLRLVAQGLSNREIGERLFLALDTIKGHNRRIFGKLGVQRRTEAVARARELGLL